LTKIHSYLSQGSFGTSWFLLDPVLTKELRERFVLNPDEFICIQNISIDTKDQGILFEYDIHKETEVEEND